MLEKINTGSKGSDCNAATWASCVSCVNLARAVPKLQDAKHSSVGESISVKPLHRVSRWGGEKTECKHRSTVTSLISVEL